MSDETIDPYELIGVAPDATEQQIKTAYRQRSLKVHPDRHPNNPDAAAKFHELNQAYNLLLDPAKKTALDESLRVKRARAERFKQFDSKRKNLVDDLEARERAFKKARVEKFESERARELEIERVKEEGRRKMREREEALARQAEEELDALKRAAAPPAAATSTSSDGLGPLDTTVRVKYALSAHPDLSTASALQARLAQFGALDTPVLALKPKKKKEPHGPLNATAVVHFTRIQDAHSAVCASGNAAKGLADISVTWAGGAEPDALATLKQQWAQPPSNPAPSSVPDDLNDVLKRAKAFGAGQASSFPSFDSRPPAPVAAPPPSAAPAGVDFESATLMRMREMERARLEQQIREQEEAEL